MGKYIEISKKLKEDIFNGKFKEDEKLPSARKLAQNYEIILIEHGDSDLCKILEEQRYWFKKRNGNGE